MCHSYEVLLIRQSQLFGRLMTAASGTVVRMHDKQITVGSCMGALEANVLEGPVLITGGRRARARVARCVLAAQPRVLVCNHGSLTACLTVLEHSTTGHSPERLRRQGQGGKGTRPQVCPEFPPQVTHRTPARSSH